MKYRRRRMLIDLSIQGRLLILSPLCSLYSIIMVSFMTNKSLYDLASEMGVAHSKVESAISEIVLWNAAILALVLIPSFWLLTLAGTWRIAGPLYRMRQFLKGILRGSESEPCRLRRKDCLQDFCAMLNEATEPARHQIAAVPGEKAGEGASQGTREVASV